MTRSFHPPDAPEPAAMCADRAIVIPLIEEELEVSRHAVETGCIRVSRHTHHRERAVDELLHQQEVEIERIPVNRPIDCMPAVRQEGDVTIIPVVEETLRIERCLVLKEEVHIRRTTKTKRHQEEVTLRRQEATIARTITDSAVLNEGLSQPNQPQKGILHEQL